VALFLDTSFVIALEMARDNQHKAASTYWQSYIHNPLPLLTTDLVFTEIVTFFNARGIHAKAVEVGERLLQSQLVEVVNITPELQAVFVGRLRFVRGNAQAPCHQRANL
jgi:uncharacterized protein